MFNGFKHAIYEFEYVALQDTALHVHHGSMLRGLLGNALHDMLCSNEGLSSCDHCPTQGECLYVKLFYGINSQNTEERKLSTYKLPNPYVIKPLMSGVQTLKRGDPYRFQLVLIGDETVKLGLYYLLAAKDMTTFRFHQINYRFKLTAMRDVVGNKLLNFAQFLNPENIIQYEPALESNPITQKCLITLKTPLRIQSRGKFVNDLTFEILIKSALRRLSMLQELYCYTPLDIDHQRVIEASKSVRCSQQNTFWTKLERHSVYKNQDISIGGLVGTCIFEGDLDLYAEILSLSRLMHIGKSCTNGDGWIEVEYLK